MSNRYLVEEHTEYVPETNQFYTTQTIRKLPSRWVALFLCFFFLGWLSDLLLLIVGEFKDKDGRIVK